MTTDFQYLGFMKRLAEDQRGKNGLILSEWEQKFLASFVQAQRQSLWFTPGRREATDRMWRRLGPELNFPHPLDTVAERPALAPADASGCEYLVRDEAGRQRRCNEPATCREPGRLRYCEAHGETVRLAMKRTNMNFRLVRLEQKGTEGTKLSANDTNLREL
jgi:hypothetical protein